MSTTMRLGVNIDHAATVRQARYREAGQACGRYIEPDPLLVARLAEQAGADSITIHLREDRRHIVDEDVRRIREGIGTWLNLEMAAIPEMLEIALRVKPDSVCLVPERREEVTTEGGLEVAGQLDRIREMTGVLTEAGIVVSLFIDPDEDQIRASAEAGAPWIELHTGAFAHGYHDESERLRQWERLRVAAEVANTLGLTVNAGHGINYHNIRDIIRLPYLHELNIGHSIISRALLFGIAEAVREMKTRMHG